MESLRTALGEVQLHRLARLGRDRRPQLELGQRRTQVEARPADNDRPAAALDERIDLGVRELGEAACGELIAYVCDSDEPVFEPLSLLSVGCSAENLQAAVDLNRVAADRNRVFASLPQNLSELD